MEEGGEEESESPAAWILPNLSLPSSSASIPTPQGPVLRGKS